VETLVPSEELLLLLPELLPKEEVLAAGTLAGVVFDGGGLV
jgi:hypothetical protein